MVIKVGEVYPSNNYGDMEVIEYVTALKVGVRFLATGYEKYAEASTIRKGQVKDRFSPTVFGVGYLGEGIYTSWANGKMYVTWCNMLQRCYDSSSQTNRPTYKGCSVVKEWHNFQVFGKWFDNNYIDGHQIDKDIKVKDNKVYGPDTCLFVTHAENAEAAAAVSVIYKSPDGGRVEVYNITKFARENGLDNSALTKVKNGKAGQHKGWTLWKEEEKQSGR